MFYRMRKTYPSGQCAGYGSDYYEPTGEGFTTYEEAAESLAHEIMRGRYGSFDHASGIWDAEFAERYPQYLDDDGAFDDAHDGAIEARRDYEFQFILSNLYDEYGFHIMECESDDEIHRLVSL
jgi:hypothetical protein